MIKEIYCDLDDVLGNFLKHYHDTFGVNWHDIQDVHEQWNNLNHYPLWWANMPLRENDDTALYFWKELSNICDSNDIRLKILTATGVRYQPVSVEKKVWCWKKLGVTPDRVITVEAAHMKKKYATPNSVLIDDSVSNINDWHGAGGIGILHKNFEESTKELNEVLKGYKYMNVEIDPQKEETILKSRQIGKQLQKDMFNEWKEVNQL